MPNPTTGGIRTIFYFTLILAVAAYELFSVNVEEGLNCMPHAHLRWEH